MGVRDDGRRAPGLVVPIVSPPDRRRDFGLRGRGLPVLRVVATDAPVARIARPPAQPGLRWMGQGCRDSSGYCPRDLSVHGRLRQHAFIDFDLVPGDPGRAPFAVGKKPCIMRSEIEHLVVDRHGVLHRDELDIGRLFRRPSSCIFAAQKCATGRRPRSRA